MSEFFDLSLAISEALSVNDHWQIADGVAFST